MRLLRVMTALAILFSFYQAPAQELDQGDGVAVETSENYSLAYKERRSKHGVLFSIGMEKFYPIDYESLSHDVYIENIIGEDRIDLIGFEIGYKHNVSIGSLAVLFNYAQGTATGTRDLDFVKQGLSGNVALDALFSEPWVAPYFQAGVHQFAVTESTSTTSESASTAFSFNYRYGLLFQLNWIEKAIDKTSQTDALRSSGLENTFVDIYFSQYLPSGGAQDPTVLGSEGEPNLASGGEIGMGLKLEF